MVVLRKLYTYHEFEQIIHLPENEDRLLELINGEIVETMPKLTHGLVAGRIQGEIYIYLKQNPIGEVVIEVDHKLVEDNENMLRPDVSFISRARLQEVDPDENVPFMPDLAVEIKSPSNYYTGQEGLREKAAYYLAHGSKLVWLVDTDKKQVEVHVAGQPTRTITIDATLDGGDVLPGFTLSLTELFK